MMIVRTYNSESNCTSDFCLAVATEKIAKMVVDDVPADKWWADVLDDETGQLHYQCWWENGMLHTWCAADNSEDEMILFL